jgi:hypothetical protein
MLFQMVTHTLVVKANKQATIRLKMDYVAGVIVMLQWDFRSFSGLHHLYV